MFFGVESSNAFKNGVFKKTSFIGNVSQELGRSLKEWYNLYCIKKKVKKTEI